jgi:hypothetical protein
MGDDPLGAVGSPVNAGAFLPDCWIEGLFSFWAKRWYRCVFAPVRA